MQNNSIVLMYALSPCHAGSGSSMGVVDLPIQRERHTNWPVIQASGVKGAFRANFDLFKNNIADDDKAQIQQFEKLTDSIFGSSSSKASDKSGYAGSFSISDAKILAYPMRSNAAPFVWITCPAILKRLIKDVLFIGKAAPVFVWKDIETLLSGDNTGSKAFKLHGSFGEHKDILLEDYQVRLESDNSPIAGLQQLVSEYMISAERLLLVSDEVFDYGVSDCTQITAKISIDSTTGTTLDGSLRYQEELPADTIMYSVVCWGDTKNSIEDQLKAETIKKFICEQVIEKYIQIAGDETLGRGIFELSWK